MTVQLMIPAGKLSQALTAVDHSYFRGGKALALFQHPAEGMGMDAHGEAGLPDLVIFTLGNKVSAV